MEWVKDKYYYLVYFRDFYKPKIFPVFFTSKAAAKRAIEKKGKKKRPFYEVITGPKLREFEFKYVLRLGRLGDFTKYDYPKELDTTQKRKNYRTIMRRRLRRMGMLTPVKNKYNIGTKPIQGRLIKNRQAVANSPNTIAQAFRIERKGRRLYYIILHKQISKKNGILFEVKALRVDTLRKTLKKVIIKVRNTDILIPYLITEILKIYGNETILMDTLRREGVQFDSGTKKGILKRMRKELAQ